MVVTVQKINQRVVVAVKGRMDAVCTTDFERVLDEQISAQETEFVIDFGGLEYISSAGLQCLLAAAKRLESKQGRIVLADLRGPVKDVFEISGFDTIFTIVPAPDSPLPPV